MVSDPKNGMASSPSDRLMRKRLAARLRQQRCRARKKELSLAKKQRDQQEGKNPAQVPVPARRHHLVPQNQMPPGAVVSRSFGPQSIHRRQHPQLQPLHKTQQPHRPHQPHQPHRSHQPHQPYRGQSLHQPPHQIFHIPPPPSHHLQPRRHPQTHAQPLYLTHRPVHPLFITEPNSRMQHNIGSVVSFDDGSCAYPRVSLDGTTKNGKSGASSTCLPPSAFYLKPEHLLSKHEGKTAMNQYPAMPSSTSSSASTASSGEASPTSLAVPTVSPTMSAKPVVDPDAAASFPHQVPNRSPTKEDTAIEAMLSLRTGSFGA